jgi:hypothetical protein
MYHPEIHACTIIKSSSLDISFRGEIIRNEGGFAE